MKKLSLAAVIALGTTALTSQVASADNHSNYVSAPSGLEVKVGGFLDFQMGMSPQERAAGIDNDSIKFQNDTEVHFRVEGTTDAGSIYGAVIELEADVSGDGDNDGLNADKTYLYFENDFGGFEMGNVDGAENRLKVDATTISRATGGVGGDFYDYINNPVSAYSAAPMYMIVTPDLPSAYLHEAGQNNEEEATKISYYSPNYGGVKFGLSYAPESANNGQNVAGTANALSQENLIGLGLMFENIIDENEGFAVYGSITAEMGDGVGTNEDREAFAVGLGMDYKGFSIAGSFGDLGDITTGVSGEYYDVAIAYNILGAGVSLGYLASEVDDSANIVGTEFENISLSIDYELGAGILPYFEVNFVDFQSDNAAYNNGDAVILLAGVELSF